MANSKLRKKSLNSAIIGTQIFETLTLSKILINYHDIVKLLLVRNCMSTKTSDGTNPSGKTLQAVLGIKS